MTRDLQTTVIDLTKALAKLLNIDPKSWSLKWDFSNFISQMGEFSKMLNMIADLLNAIKDGRWSEAASIGKQLLNQGSGNPSAMPMVTDSANSTAEWMKNTLGFDPRSVGRTVRGWFGDDEPDQHGQSVKRPQPTKAGSELLGWMQPMLTNLEQLYRLPEGLLKSVAITESGGNQFAVSGAGAKGLFQFMDGTARDMGLRGNDVFDPEKAAQAAAKYLSRLLQANGGDLSKALASYNWGIGNVQKHGMALMPQETRNYIPKVMSNMPGNGVQVDQKIPITFTVVVIRVRSEQKLSADSNQQMLRSCAAIKLRWANGYSLYALSAANAENRDDSSECCCVRKAQRYAGDNRASRRSWGRHS